MSSLGKVRVTLTPLLGNTTSHLALSSLLCVNETKILLDCGWTSEFDVNLLAPLKKVAKELDAVVITQPDIEHAGALPYLVGVLNCTCPIFITSPASRLAELTLIDAYNSLKNTPLAITSFTLDHIGAAFRWEQLGGQVHAVRFSEESIIAGNVILSAHPSGYSLGGAVWKIMKNTERILYAPVFNHRDEKHLPRCDFEALGQAPTVMIIDGLAGMELVTHETQSPNANQLAPGIPLPGISNRGGATIAQIQAQSREQMAHQLIQHCISSLSHGGPVLIPAETSGRALELLLLLEEFYGSDYTYPIFFLSTVADHVLPLAQVMVEYMPKAIRLEAEGVLPPQSSAQASNTTLRRANPSLPFDFSNSRTNIHVVHDLNAIYASLSRGLPPLVVCSFPSLDLGFSKHLFTQWSALPKATILLTKFVHPSGSIGSQLAGAEPPTVVNSPEWTLVPLDAAELRQRQTDLLTAKKKQTLDEAMQRRREEEELEMREIYNQSQSNESGQLQSVPDSTENDVSNPPILQPIVPEPAKSVPDVLVAGHRAESKHGDDTGGAMLRATTGEIGAHAKDLTSSESQVASRLSISKASLLSPYAQLKQVLFADELLSGDLGGAWKRSHTPGNYLQLVRSLMEKASLPGNEGYFPSRDEKHELIQQLLQFRFPMFQKDLSRFKKHVLTPYGYTPDPDWFAEDPTNTPDSALTVSVHRPQGVSDPTSQTLSHHAFMPSLGSLPQGDARSSALAPYYAQVAKHAGVIQEPGDEADAAVMTSDSMLLMKKVKNLQTLPMRASIVHVQGLSGRTNSKALLNILGSTSPMKVVILAGGATDEAASALGSRVQSILGPKKVPQRAASDSEGADTALARTAADGRVFVNPPSSVPLDISSHQREFTLSIPSSEFQKVSWNICHGHAVGHCRSTVLVKEVSSGFSELANDNTSLSKNTLVVQGTLGRNSLFALVSDSGAQGSGSSNPDADSGMFSLESKTNVELSLESISSGSDGDKPKNRGVWPFDQPRVELKRNRTEEYLPPLFAYKKQKLQEKLPYAEYSYLSSFSKDTINTAPRLLFAPPPEESMSLDLSLASGAFGNTVNGPEESDSDSAVFLIGAFHRPLIRLRRSLQEMAGITSTLFGTNVLVTDGGVVITHGTARDAMETPIILDNSDARELQDQVNSGSIQHGDDPSEPDGTDFDNSILTFDVEGPLTEEFYKVKDIVTSMLQYL